MDHTPPPRGDGERGATAVEYGLMMALIALAIFGAVLLFGGQLADSFHDDCVKMFKDC